MPVCIDFLRRAAKRGQEFWKRKGTETFQGWSARNTTKDNLSINSKSLSERIRVVDIVRGLMLLIAYFQLCCLSISISIQSDRQYSELARSKNKSWYFLKAIQSCAYTMIVLNLNSFRIIRFDRCFCPISLAVFLQIITLRLYCSQQVSDIVIIQFKTDSFWTQKRLPLFKRV